MPRSKVVNRSGVSMIEEEDENATLIAHTRFVGGQVNMLMELCLTFIAANTNPVELARRFEATVKKTLAHSDTTLIFQEYLDGELDIVNRVRLDVMSALPRKANLREETPAIPTAPEIKADKDKLAHRKSNTSSSLEALTIEWTERASGLERKRLLCLSTTPTDTH
jgi:hypothetical protein